MASYSSTYSLTDGTVAYGSQVRFELSALGSSVNNVINEQIPVGANIADTKLAQITTGGKVDLTALTTTSQAQGDIAYASGASSYARLAAGTSGQFLKTLGAGANPLWAFAITQFKIVVTTRDISLSSQWTVTGAGFTPKAVIFLGGIDSNVMGCAGFADSTGSGFGVTMNNSSANTEAEAALIVVETSTGVKNVGTINSYNSDGVVIDFSKTGSPTGTLECAFLFIG